MKRLFITFVTAITLMLVPAQLSVQGSAVSVNSSTAYACSKDQVELSVSLLRGGNKCVDNTAGSGGAIVAYLKMVLQLLGLAIGAVIMLMLIIGGVQYIVSAGDPGQVKNAKNRIVNAITGLVLYMFAYALLNFIVPGGIL